MIELKNIDLSGVTLEEQIKKLEEEQEELDEAFAEYAANRTEENKEHFMEEWWDETQADLGCIEKTVGVTAKDLMDYYPKHLEKLENRPRKKVE